MKTLNKQKIYDELGYEIKTTFYDDFSIAEPFGKSAIEDTYKRAVKSWKSDVEYMTELTMMLNWKIWEHYETNLPLAELYQKLWEKQDNLCLRTFKDDELSYYLRTID